MSGCEPGLRSDWFRIHVAVRCLRAGGLVAHATEGVWGLACDPCNGRAAARLLAAKGRSPAKGLILIGAHPSCFAPELAALAPERRAPIEASWPGPVTWLVPSSRFPWWISGGRRGRRQAVRKRGAQPLQGAFARLPEGASRLVAARVPGHAQARALCASFGGPLVSTSANPSGRPSAARILQVRRWLHGAVDCVLPGATSGRKGPSQLRALDGTRLR